MDMFRYWQVGSVGSASWDNIILFCPFYVLGLLISILSAPALNALALGEEMSKGLGIRPGIVRIISSFGGILLCGAITALVGPIGFIGLISPHLVRLILGPNLKYVIPMSALSGAIILTISDVIGRVLGSPSELEVGIITAIIGAPVLIFITVRSKVHTL